jgi:hypothetical protein
MYRYVDDVGMTSAAAGDGVAQQPNSRGAHIAGDEGARVVHGRRHRDGFTAW